jgi:HK97 family phage major capsid protein
MELTKEQFDEMVKSLAKGEIASAMKEQFEAFRKEITDAQRKAIFPEADSALMAGQTKTFAGSVIDFSGLPSMLTSANMDQKQLAYMFASKGIPFKKLSPAMEMFAKGILKTRCNHNTMVANGFNLEEYKTLCREQMKQTGMSEGVNADGGFTVPVEYVASVYEFAFALSPILSKVTRLPMSSNTLKYPKLSQSEGNYFGGVLVTWTDEGHEKTQTKPVFEQLSFTAHKLAAVVVMTDELIDDSLVNIVNYVTGLLTKAIMYELERVVIDGTGVGQPLGITNDPIVVANAVARTNAGAISDNDLYNMEAAIDEAFRNLSWICRRRLIANLRALKDTVGQPIVHDTWGSFMSTPVLTPTMLGYPYYITRNARAIGHRGDLILGDLSAYLLAVRSDLKVDMSQHVYFLTDETCLRFVMRVDGMPGSSYAFKILGGTGS